jgi:hypothetical protein
MGGFNWRGGQSVQVVLHTHDPASFAGDYNPDGIIDAADYVVWRKGLGTTFTEADYDAWQIHFGQTAARASSVPNLVGGSSPAVPEPTTLAQLALILFHFVARRRRV